MRKLTERKPGQSVIAHHTRPCFAISISPPLAQICNLCLVPKGNSIHLVLACNHFLALKKQKFFALVGQSTVSKTAPAGVPDLATNIPEKLVSF